MELRSLLGLPLFENAIYNFHPLARLPKSTSSELSQVRSLVGVLPVSGFGDSSGAGASDSTSI